MNSIVTQRFIQCHHQLKQNNQVRSSRQFALALDYLPQSLSEILKGRRDVTIDLLRKAVEVYQINPIFLYTGEGEMFLKPQEQQELRVLTIVKDEQQQDQILHLSTQDQRVYPQSISDTTFLAHLPSFSLPQLPAELPQRSFEVCGHEMEPTFWPGDKVVGTFVEPANWETSVENNHVYIVVSKEAVYLQRVRNELKAQQRLLLLSDNVFFDTFALAVQDVQEIWHVHTKISAFQPLTQRHHSSMQQEFGALREMIGAQKEQIQLLNDAIAKMVNP